MIEPATSSSDICFGKNCAGFETVLGFDLIQRKHKSRRNITLSPAVGLQGASAVGAVC